MLLFDAAEKGDEGAKDALWKLAQTGLDVKLVWSRLMCGGRLREHEAESLTPEVWSHIETTLGKRAD